MEKVLTIWLEKKMVLNDGSYFGRYIDQLEPWAIDRETGEYITLLPADHQFPKRGLDCRFFKPWEGWGENGSPLYQAEDKADYQRLEQLNRGEWWLLHIVAYAEIQQGEKVAKIQSSGAWGVASDRGAEYLAGVRAMELDKLKRKLICWGFAELAIAAALLKLELIDK